ncbi:MAG: FtsX-like permease family protein, partial [Prevotellaceae bacterium]|nr:FtsX-like permease family protein [Prevotellaceae bacterium]
NIYFSGFKSWDDIRVGEKKTVEILLIVALVLLISAIFNYINLTIAQAGKRAKEMATRRLMGESQLGIVCRYIRESFVFTLGCFVLGCVPAYLLRPWMNELLTTNIALHVDWISVTIAMLLVIVISLISGLLPAFISLRFKPIDVVKGSFRFRSKMVLSRVFIICQNVISTVLIAVALTMTIQIRHLANLPYGYNTDNLIQLITYHLGYPDMDAPNELAKRLRNLPCVEEVGMYLNAPIHCSDNGLQNEDERMSWISLTSIDSTSFKLLGFKVVEQYSAPLNGT